MIRLVLIIILILASQLRGASVGSWISPDGKERAKCQIPGRLHQKNTGGSDGAGLCVFASLKHAGHHNSIRAFQEIFDWMRRHPGGGYPSKVDAMMKRMCEEKGIEVPQYLQVESKDLEILKLACKNRLMPSVTYSKSPTGRYGGATISHMVTLVHASDNWFAILDNNYIGENSIEWMTPQEFLRTYAYSGNGWSVIPLSGQAPPPMPHNGRDPVLSSFGVIFCAGPPKTKCKICPNYCTCGCQRGEDCRCAAAHLPTGVDRTRLSHTEEKYSISGEAIGSTEAYRQIESNRLDDISAKKQIVIIGGLEDRVKARKIVGNQDWAVITEWAPSDWHVSERGFQPDNRQATVLIQAADGRVLHRQTGLDDLARAVALSAPNYDPSLDPDLRVGGAKTYAVAIILALALYAITMLIQVMFPKILSALKSWRARPKDYVTKQELLELLREVKRNS